MEKIDEPFQVKYQTKMDGVYRELKKFLDARKVKHDEAFSHVSVNPNGTYFIDMNEVGQASTFWNLYKEAAIKNCKLTLLEKPKPSGPLRFDFDFSWPISESPLRKYTASDINRIVRIIQTVIKSVIDPNSPQPKTTWCIILEKKSPKTVESKSIHKDGFHIHFPFMIVESWAFEAITKKVKEEIQNDGVFESKGFIQPEKVVDTGLSKKVWLMYGSAKDQVAEPYLVTKYYRDKINSSGSVVVVRDPKEFWSEFMSDNETEDPTFHLPSLLSIIQHTSLTPLNPSFEAQKEIQKPRQFNHINDPGRTEKEVLDDYADVRTLVGMLSNDRAQSYDTWMDVGWTLYNIGLGHPQYLELWDEFSRRSSKYIQGECEDKWRSMSFRGKTIGSLRRMASKDNPGAYAEWCKTQENHLIDSSLCTAKPLENLIAKVVHHLYKDTFVCAHSDKKIWFTFLGNRWSQIDQQGYVLLKRKVSDEVANKYLAYGTFLSNKAIAITDANEKAAMVAKSSRANAVWAELQKSGFLGRVVDMCSMHFFDPGFAAKFDENKMLFACNNGVLDLANFCFRETRPDDYVTLTCGIDYYPHTMDHPHVQEVVGFFRKVFVDEELYDYFFDTLCACLEGGNPNKNFVIHTGQSGGGKTATMEFVKQVFGDYCIKFPRELFIEGAKNSSAQARPELERVRGRRLALGQEVTHRERFNIGVLKELTGNDSFFVRTLWDKGSDIKPMFTLMVCCNDPPQFPGDDDATYDRLKMLEYASKFVLPAQLAQYPVSADVKEQFRMKRFRADLSFDDNKRKELAPAFLWYLFQRYIKYKRTGLREPAKVTEHVRNYRNRHDPYQLYVSEKLEKVENIVDGGPHLTLTHLFQDYTAWFKITFGDPHAKIKRPDFQANITKKIGHPMVKGQVTFWNNYRLRDIQQEEETAFKSADASHSKSVGSGGGAVVTAQSSKAVKAPSRNASKDSGIGVSGKADSRNASKASSSSESSHSFKERLRPRKTSSNEE